MPALEGLEDRVRRAVYEGFILEGRAPSRAEIAAGLGLDEAEVKRTLARLSDGRVLVLQPESSEILMANPFSAVATLFLVEAGPRRWWGNCIWDGLGIPAMLRIAARVRTSCSDCGEAIELEVAGGKVEAAEAVAHFTVPARRWWDDIVFT